MHLFRFKLLHTSFDFDIGWGKVARILSQGINLVCDAEKWGLQE